MKYFSLPANDTLAYDDNVHKVSQCTPSILMKIITILCMGLKMVNLVLGAIIQGWQGGQKAGFY